jgi:hypothetical protein
LKSAVTSSSRANPATECDNVTCPAAGEITIRQPQAPIAIKAMAAKLARLVYRMLRYGMKYVDQGAAFYEAQHRLSQIKQLKWKAHKLGFQIVQTPAA